MKKNMLILLLGVLMGCEKTMVEKEKLDADCVEKIDANIICTLQYDPVCGCNGKTYGNSCIAGASGIRVVYKGECKK